MPPMPVVVGGLLLAAAAAAVAARHRRWAAASGSSDSPTSTPPQPPPTSAASTNDITAVLEVLTGKKYKTINAQFLKPSHLNQGGELGLEKAPPRPPAHEHG